MSRDNGFENGTKSLNPPVTDDVHDLELELVLRNFRQSVHAWSAATYARPREGFAAQPHRAAWGRVAAWALSSALVVGLAGTGVYERHQKQELARIEAQRNAERQRELAAQQARETEELLAQVDSDVSREVPNAMEPLAQLMAEDDGQ